MIHTVIRSRDLYLITGIYLVALARREPRHSYILAGWLEILDVPQLFSRFNYLQQSFSSQIIISVRHYGPHGYFVCACAGEQCTLAMIHVRRGGDSTVAVRGRNASWRATCWCAVDRITIDQTTPHGPRAPLLVVGSVSRLAWIQPVLCHVCACLSTLRGSFSTRHFGVAYRMDSVKQIRD